MLSRATLDKKRRRQRYIYRDLDFSSLGRNDMEKTPATGRICADIKTRAASNEFARWWLRGKGHWGKVPRHRLMRPPQPVSFFGTFA
jgi:hypothetical protein